MSRIWDTVGWLLPIAVTFAIVLGIYSIVSATLSGTAAFVVTVVSSIVVWYVVARLLYGSDGLLADDGRHR